MTESETEEERTMEGVRIRWRVGGPHRVYLFVSPTELWYLPSAEAALTQIALVDDSHDPARWTRAKAREMTGRCVTPLPMPEDATGFWTVATTNHWLCGGWVN